MIETTITKIQYDADGVQRRWSIPFPYADVKHISIYTKVGEGPTVKVVDNYDIDKDDSVVIYPTVASGQEPLAAGTKIIIARETPETQLEDASQVHFTSKDVERGLDKLTMITQELSTTASETMEVSADAFESAEEAVNSAAQANRIAEEAKTIAGQAVDIATDAKSIAEGIDAKATQALTNSNTAVNTANSAKETAENIDSKATQALANSTTALEKATEAKNTADSYQGQITIIESKIPADATEQNKLVTKTQMDNAIAGISVDLTGYYNRDNLLGADEIEIVPEPVEGGIDENTLSCFHLDGTAVDEVTGYTLNPTMDNSVHKFGTGSSMWTSSTSFPWSLNSYGSFSFDYWYYHRTSRSSYLGLSKTAYYAFLLGLYFKSGATKPDFRILDSKHAINVDFEQNKWTHVYVYYNAEDRSFHLFINGKEVFSLINSTDFSGVKEFKNDGYTESRFDEIRISKCIRWTEDFEPPTKPYSVAVPTGNYVVRNKTKLVHKSDIGVANGVAGLDANAKVPTEQIPVATTSALGGVKPDGTTITVTEDGTISAATGSDTIGLSIGDVVFSYSNLASENTGKLPLFTGETIASANTIYPDFYNWVSAHTELQCTSTEYEASLTTYGECAKYVIGGGSLRLPLIKNYIKAANPSEGIKNIEAGLPDHTHKTPYGKNDNGDYHAQGGARPHISTDAWFSTIYGYSKDSTSASASNPIYGKSSTVTPASTTLYPWVVAYTAAIPASTAQAAEFQQGLSGKADTNLGNLSTAGKDLASGLGMPSNRYIDLTLGASGATYTAPANGWLVLNKIAQGNGQEIRLINNSNSLRGYAISPTNNNVALSAMVPCLKGDGIYIYYSASGQVEDFKFIYAEGAE